MTTCTLTALTIGIWKDKEGLDMKLNTDPLMSEVTFLYRRDGTTKYYSGRLREGETWIINEYKDQGLTWELTFTEAYDYNTARVEVCNTSSEIPPPVPEPDPELEVDYGRIETATANIVFTAESNLKERIRDVKTSVIGVKGDIDSAFTRLKKEIADQTAGLVTLIGDMEVRLKNEVTDQTASISTIISGMEVGLSAQINGVSGGFAEGIEGVKDKIDGLTFPSLDNIRETFLSVCSDLAIALWDAILDKIEERYPDDEEER